MSIEGIVQPRDSGPLWPADRPTPLAKVLGSLGVELPAAPLDLSAAVAATGIRRSYVIVMTGRTGSTWLATALRQINGAGFPLEYFTDDFLSEFGRSMPRQSVASFVADLVARYNRDGTFGFKIDPMRLSWLEQYVSTVPTFGGPATPWIDMRRLDLVKQAFSFGRAKRSGRWHRFARNPDESNAHVSVPDGQVWHEMGLILRNEQWINAFYARNDLRPLRIFYEELQDSHNHLLRRVLHKIDPGRQWGSLSHVEDITLKLAAEADAAEEFEFVTRHIEKLSQILAERDRFDFAPLLNEG